MLENQIMSLSYLCESEEEKERRLEQYVTFYNKKDYMHGVYDRGYGYQVTRLLKDDILFENIQTQKPIETKPFYCLNNPNKITTLIRENEQKKFFLREGLIKTYPKNFLVSMFVIACEDMLPEELYSLKRSDILNTEDETRVIEYVDVYDEEKDEEVPTLITLKFVCYEDSDIKYLTKRAIDAVYMCGYNYSSSRIEYSIKQPIEGKKVIQVVLTFEPKYSEYKFEFKEFLYHVTPYNTLEKIRRNGLCPKFQQEHFKYPERVYLFNNITKDQIIGYGTDKTLKKKQDKLAILKIRSENLKNSTLYKNGKMNFYVDGKLQNINNSEPQAIFTYGNIPKDLIEDEVIVCELNRNTGVVTRRYTEKFQKQIQTVNKIK